MGLNVFDTVDEVLNGLAEYFVATAEKSIDDHGQFSVALSGGSSPKKLYELLTSDKFKDKVDWTKVHFFFGDERNVPQDDKDSNYLMAKTAFAPLELSDTQWFPVNTPLGPEAAAAEYTTDIEKYFAGEEVKFDLILLGLGDNSHTASLFPHTTILHDNSVSVKSVWVEEVNSFRISMTAPMINKGQHIAFLVYGAGKAIAVKHILKDESNIEEYPAQLINPTSGDLQWFLDKDAAAEVV